jgi:ribosomal protein S25
LQSQLRDTARRARKRGVAERLAGDLIGLPFVSRPEVAARYEITGQGAINAIRGLIEIGLLEPASFHGPRRAQVYVAPAVLEILSS